MAGVFLGMSAGTLTALGISVVGSTASSLGSLSKANEAKRRSDDALRQGERLQQKVIDRIGASNYMKQLTINKKASEDAIDALIAGQASQQLGVGDQRGASAGAARQQAILTKGLSQVQDFDIEQQRDIQKAIAEEDRRIAEQIGGIELGQANQQFEAGQAYQKQEADLRAQARKSAGEAISTVGEAVIPGLVEGIDTKVAQKQLLDKASLNAPVAAGSETPIQDYFKNTMSGFGGEVADFDNNEALKGAILSNEAFGKGFGELLYSGAGDEQVTDYLFQNLPFETVQGIIGGIGQ